MKARFSQLKKLGYFTFRELGGSHVLYVYFGKIQGYHRYAEVSINGSEIVSGIKVTEKDRLVFTDKKQIK